MGMQVVAFSDTYFPSINGVTYTIKSWRDGWEARGGRMDVVYPAQDGYEPSEGEHPVRSLPFPFYNDFQLGLPELPSSIPDPDLVHLHGPFTMGISGLRLARRTNAPVVSTYHTPISRYAEYLSSHGRVVGVIERAAKRYEQVFYRYPDVIIVPSHEARREFLSTVDVETPVEVVSNGVDIETFRPTDSESFRKRHEIDPDQPIIGYTGRHGYEKSLEEIIDVAAETGYTTVMGGDGPARSDLEQYADRVGADVRFLGFLDRSKLPEFYSSLDVFAFPSRNETQGLVALESFACGTPVVSADAGALSDTVEDGVTGYRYTPGNIREFAERIERALAESERLRNNCLDRRASISVEASVDALTAVYDRVR
jgi:glycosyltransferase involved in cell wall biosynthesis